MPKEPISAFISYSRTDNEFVDRLEADLQARNFRTWVDRRKLEGGQNWLDELEKAIEHCQVLLTVLSPQAVDSPYVRMEYRYAQRLGKPVIPLDYQPCEKVPIDLNGIQWVNFESSYEQGIKELLIALSHIKPTTPLPSSIQMTRDITTRLELKAEESELVLPQPAPPPPDPNLNDLYRAGVTTMAEGDLERAVTLWQQVLDRDPNFGNGTLALRMEKLRQKLLPIRVQRLRERAEQAHQAGEWRQEIGAWQALLGLEPQGIQAKERISVAQHNQKYAFDYENAQQFVKEGNIPSAKTQLELLWQDAPYYGDPAGLAVYVGLQVPASYEANKAQKAAENRLATENRKKEIQNLIGTTVGAIIVCAFIGALVGGGTGGGSTGTLYGSIVGTILAIVIGVVTGILTIWPTRNKP